MIVVGAGNRVRSKVLPSLKALELSCAIFATRQGLLENEKVYKLSLEELGEFSEPKFVVVSVPQNAKAQVLVSIESLGWNCPILIDTPVSKLQPSARRNCYVLEEAALLQASNGDSIIAKEKSFTFLYIHGALPFGHGLAALNSALGRGQYPIASANFLSILGLHVFSKGLVLWFYPKLKRRGYVYLSGSIPAEIAFGLGYKAEVRNFHWGLSFGSKKGLVRPSGYPWILDFQILKDSALSRLLEMARLGNRDALLDWESGIRFEAHTKSPLVFSRSKLGLRGGTRRAKKSESS